LRISEDHILAKTLLFRDVDRAEAAFAVLSEVDAPAVVVGLCELIEAPPKASIGVAAIRRLAALETSEASSMIDISLDIAIDSKFSLVRIAAIEALVERDAAPDRLVEIIQSEDAWMVRRAALKAVATLAEEKRWGVLSAADDPHWRVRHQLTLQLLAWGEDGKGQSEILDRLTRLATEPRAAGVLTYLATKWNVGANIDVNTIAEITTAIEPEELAIHQQPWWDWDGAVLLRQIELLPSAEQKAMLNFSAELLTHNNERLRTFVLRKLKRDGTDAQLVQAASLLAKPRYLGCRELLAMISSLPEERQPRITALKSITPPPISPTQVRATALTTATAAEILASPQKETSWRVLAEAARICKTPLWKLTPETAWSPPELVKPTEQSIELSSCLSIKEKHSTVLHGTEISPLGLSGHYGLPPEGFGEAFETGVNVMFWEPNYSTMTAFYRRLSAADRRRIQLTIGTFEATPQRIRADVDRALRTLGIEQISMFLLFWVRSWQRISDEVLAEIESLTQFGKIAAHGLSTHNRTLAMQAMERDWNPVMVRHSAAHRGAEEAVFGHAVQHDVKLITFNNTCYGRLLQSDGENPPPTAADCYRFSLSQPGVSLCWTAPSTCEQLRDNLKAMTEPELPPHRREALIAQGANVYAEDKLFERCVRAIY